MSCLLSPDLCVIGAGAAGLAVAAGAAQLGAEVVLVERAQMGGDCLNFGCVPSKSLLAAARLADLWRRADRFGLHLAAPQVDLAAVGESVERVIAAIAPNDLGGAVRGARGQGAARRGAFYRPAVGARR